jgi:hypothetical protein
VGFFAGVVIAIGAISALLVPPALRAQPSLEPGVWRVTVTSTTNGKPDPNQDSKECLRDELKDLAAYFAPQLEEAKASCTRTRQPSEDPKNVAYRMQCSGEGFTVDALTSVVIEDARHFTVSMRIHSKTSQESAVVVAKGDARWTGACPGK